MEKAIGYDEVETASEGWKVGKVGPLQLDPLCESFAPIGLFPLLQHSLRSVESQDRGLGVPPCKASTDISRAATQIEDALGFQRWENGSKQGYERIMGLREIGLGIGPCLRWVEHEFGLSNSLHGAALNHDMTGSGKRRRIDGAVGN